MNALIPKKNASLTGKERERELLKKQRAWQSVEMPSKYLTKSLEWYESDDACVILTKHLVRRYTPHLYALTGRATLNKKQQAWAYLVSQKSKVASQTYAWYTSPAAATTMLPYLIKLCKNVQLGGASDCKYGRIKQISGTCWLNSILNGFILSSGMNDLVKAQLEYEIEGIGKRNSSLTEDDKHFILSTPDDACPVLPMKDFELERYKTDDDTHLNELRKRTYEERQRKQPLKNMVYRVLYNSIVRRIEEGIVADEHGSPINNIDTLLPINNKVNEPRHYNAYEQVFCILVILSSIHLSFKFFSFLLNQSGEPQMWEYNDDFGLSFVSNFSVQIEEGTDNITLTTPVSSQWSADSLPVILVHSALKPETCTSGSLPPPSLKPCPSIKIVTNEVDKYKTGKIVPFVMYNLEFVYIRISYHLGMSPGHAIVGYKCVTNDQPKYFLYDSARSDQTDSVFEYDWRTIHHETTKTGEVISSTLTDEFITWFYASIYKDPIKNIHIGMAFYSNSRWTRSS